MEQITSRCQIRELVESPYSTLFRRKRPVPYLESPLSRVLKYSDAQTRKNQIRNQFTLEFRKPLENMAKDLQFESPAYPVPQSASQKPSGNSSTNFLTSELKFLGDLVSAVKSFFLNPPTSPKVRSIVTQKILAIKFIVRV